MRKMLINVGDQYLYDGWGIPYQNPHYDPQTKHRYVSACTPVRQPMTAKEIIAEIKVEPFDIVAECTRIAARIWSINEK